jgi:hypothetical protein
MSFSYFAAYLEAINNECDDWQSAHWRLTFAWFCAIL